ncbi:hypothetical protein J2S10_005288 [Neobacillus ginsengisoli]|uniref:YqzE family protein n=1 Tax=Neobacillus ginsengisoli TaxID=904295 RepID=A0ABT9Y2S4_9BACI|nr:hypothetical protein [Neobacillus ginsengisoli]
MGHPAYQDRLDSDKKKERKSLLFLFIFTLPVVTPLVESNK